MSRPSRKCRKDSGTRLASARSEYWSGRAGLDSRNPAHDIGDGLAACQAEPRPPSPHVHRRGHDRRPGLGGAGTPLAVADLVGAGNFYARPPAPRRVGAFPPLHESSTVSSSVRDSDTFMHSPLRLSNRATAAVKVSGVTYTPPVITFSDHTASSAIRYSDATEACPTSGITCRTTLGRPAMSRRRRICAAMISGEPRSRYNEAASTRSITLGGLSRPRTRRCRSMRALSRASLVAASMPVSVAIWARAYASVWASPSMMLGVHARIVADFSS